jgi:secreted PhoX family phosphatase
VTTSPRGTLVVCEDHDDFNFLRGLTRSGNLITFAQNIMVGRTGDEFAGSTFSPDGHTLFVNIQASRGMTFAIWGPWEAIGVLQRVRRVTARHGASRAGRRRVRLSG